MDLEHVRIIYEGRTAYRKRVAVVGCNFYDIVLIPYNSYNEFHWYIQTGTVGYNRCTTSSGFKSLTDLKIALNIILQNVHSYGKIVKADGMYINHIH